ncbi:iron ABC transporter permease [Pseudomonas sp. GD03842]|uniref:lipocalin-like domain-containing protein n=1 Tax=unclassified Pseudomonas TaxID=196821 RepID=UPI000D3D5A5B|nr:MULTISPECIES: lipocalin-like domain-containing protein [unclassified Pseudomonas]MDH0749231.1 iron ABC transporter permease [Pseudomonas sp. GD03842]RAU49248.1 iron ABC transporter permease [Pseudomonas sp. RIT 409]RAU56011.1 iron ABC transporter permease [Pseudomonas sp. RIT 412]
MNAKALALLLATLLLSGCDDKADEEKGFAGLADDASSYAQVTPGTPLMFPRDHGAHNDFRIEWWYVTANLKDADGQSFGVQWTLFRNALPRSGAASQDNHGWNNRNLWMGHAAVTSADEHYAAERYARGGVGQAGVTLAPLTAWIDDWALASHASVENPLTDMQLQARGPQFGYTLRLTSSKPLVLQGQNGFSQKSDQGQASYYYSQPFFQAEGSLEIDGKTYRVSGPAWLDREWSSQPLTENQTGWDWFSLHLAGGADVMLYRMRQKDGEPYLTGTWINADGSTEPLAAHDIELVAQDTTQVEGRDMPTQWSVRIPRKGVDVSVEALNPYAWMNLQIPYWEGPVKVSGSQQGEGYLEMTGY